MTINLRELDGKIAVSKATCPNCGKKIHQIGFTQASKCNGITVVCKVCGKVFEVTTE